MFSFPPRFTKVLRGYTCNYIFIDESCFVRHSLYGEVLPMLQTDDCRIVLTSSHKAGQDNRVFVDLSALRNDAIFINNVSNVCRNHISAMLEDDVVSMNCPCFIFQQPHHIKADPTYRSILNSFSVSGNNKTSRNKYDDYDNDGSYSAQNDDTCKTSHKRALLSEIGIVNGDGFTQSLYDVPGSYKLATAAGRERFTTSLVSVFDHLFDHPTSSSLVFSKDIVVYIDPSPTDVGSSYNAMCFCARAQCFDDNDDGTPGDFYYVLLAVEEFSSSELGAVESHKGLALVWYNTLNNLTKLYDGYFNTVYMIPEANAINMDPFWLECGRLVKEGSDSLGDAGVTVLSPIIINSSQNRKRKVNGAALFKEATRKNKYNVYGGVKNDRFAFQLETNTIVESINNNDHDDDGVCCRGYRIGYTLSHKKVSYFLSFFSAFYNPSRTSKCAVLCASTIYSWFVRKKSLSIAMYVSSKLDTLQLKVSYCHESGRKKYKVGGKSCSKKGEFVQDDLAVAVVMSVSFMDELYKTGGKNMLTARLNAETTEF